MPTDTEIWERACERVGLWKQGERCTCVTFKGTVARGVYYCVKCKWMFNGVPSDPISRTHDIPAPAIGDPTAVVAMFEYLIPRLEPEYWYELALEVRRRGTSLALAAAVLEVPQETQL